MDNIPFNSRKSAEENICRYVGAAAAIRVHTWPVLFFIKPRLGGKEREKEKKEEKHFFRGGRLVN